MSSTWIVIIALALAAAALKLLGPLLLGGRPLPARAISIVELLAGLVVVETFGKGRSLTLDARALGAAFAVVALLRRAPLMVVVLGAAVVAAITRALT